MAVIKLTTTDAFVVTDIPHVPASGIVRMGKKILQSSAKDLARSTTYAFAAFGMERSGASAGINAEGGAQADAVRAFVEELGANHEVHISPGKGVTAEQLQPLSAGRVHIDTRALTVASVVAASQWAAAGQLTGVRVAVEGSGTDPMADLVAAGLTVAGAEVVATDPDAKPWMIWAADVDLLLAGTRPGALNHQGAAMVKADAFIPWGPIPVTTKAYLMLERAGTRVLPDFVTAAGGLVGQYLDPPEGGGLAAEVARLTGDVLEACANHPEGVMMGAFHRAEDFLPTWTEFSPFGRPLAA